MNDPTELAENDSPEPEPAEVGPAQSDAGATPTAQAGCEPAGHDIAVAAGDGANATTEPTSLREVVRLAYGLQGKQVSLKASTVEALANDGTDLESIIETVRELAPGDGHGAVPLRLVASFARSNPAAGLRRRVNAVAVAAIRARLGGHGSAAISDLLDNGSDPDAALAKLEHDLRNATLEELGFPDGTPEDRNALADSVLSTAVLLLASTHRWPSARTIRTLDRHVWQRLLARASHRPSVGQLAESRSLETLALVGDAYGVEIESLHRELQQRQQAIEATTAARRRVEADLAEEQRSHAQTLEQRDALRDELVAIRAERDAALEQRRVAGAHAADDYEQLRTRIVRVLRDRIQLLDDALHAVRNERYLVTEEFVDRSVHELRRVLDDLQDT